MGGMVQRLGGAGRGDVVALADEGEPILGTQGDEPAGAIAGVGDDGDLVRPGVGDGLGHRAPDVERLDGLHLASEVALSQAKGFSITPTTTKAEIKTAFDKEIARQRTATIALVKEETEIYDIAIGQQVDGVVLFPLGEQDGPLSGNRHKHLLTRQGEKDKMVARGCVEWKTNGHNRGYSLNNCQSFVA